jgi:hypothetical protein
MHFETWVSGQPALHGRSFVRAVVIEDQMKLLLGGVLGIELTQETQKLLVAMVRARLKLLSMRSKSPVVKLQ